MVFEFVFPTEQSESGFSSYVESVASESGVEIIERCPFATVVEGEWEAAMGFLRNCHEYISRDTTDWALTTVHIHN